jgi:hypothetical protein
LLPKPVYRWTEMPESSHPDLRCSFQDAERNPLREAIAVSTRDKIAFFEEMLLLASRSGALAPERLAERDSVGRAAQTGQKNEPDPFFCTTRWRPQAKPATRMKSILPTRPSSKSTTAMACATSRTPRADAAMCSKR